MEVSIKFNPTTDTVEGVQASVEQLFAAVAILTDNKLSGHIATETEGAKNVHSGDQHHFHMQPNHTAQIVGRVAQILPTADDETGDTTTTATHDKSGLPWDARIHSTPAKLTAKGEWRAKRNVDETLVKAVEAELRGAPAATVQQPAAPTMPAAPVMPVAPTAPAAPATYEQLVAFIGANLHTDANPTGRINEQWVKDALTAYSVTNGDLPNVASMPAETQLQILQGFKQALA